jgi:hypothetical protein
LSEGKRENKEGAKKRTRGANNKETHCKWNNEGWDQRTRRHYDEEKLKIYALTVCVTIHLSGVKGEGENGHRGQERN